MVNERPNIPNSHLLTYIMELTPALIVLFGGRDAWEHLATLFAASLI
jgi:hypothetical protein